ncbi:MAG: outer membrane beta-barrel protein, partial [Pseudomonadota bacterium]
DDRDRTILSGGVELGYNSPGPVELIAKAELSFTDFSKPLDRGGVDRDNTRLRVVVGVEIDSERPLSGAVELGYQKRWSDDPALADFSGPATEARLEWRPSRLLTLTAIARQAEEETRIANASAASVGYGELRARYEVRRFVDVTATVAYERRSFRGADRRDKTMLLGAGVEWRARETTTLTAGYRYLAENSTAPGESSRANLVWVGVEHRF